MMRGRVLVVDDDQAMCEFLEMGLTRRDFEVTWTTQPAEALDLLAPGGHDAVVTDLRMQQFDGVELCGRISERIPDLPVIVLTAFGSFESAVRAIRAGAFDFVTKPFELDELVLTLERAVKHRSLAQEVRRLREVVGERRAFGELVGESPAMQRLYELIERVAASEASVLVVGETGSGKELVARTIHQRSSRRDGPFVALNCAALPEQLLESELFGHVAGAFTDAKSDRPGLMVEASGGVLFLDEIGDMPLGLQPKLLRALQERVVRPVGGTREVPVDVRIVAATHRDLEAQVARRAFREDLYYRIDVIQVDVPPLRTRGTDVLLLAHHMIGELADQSGKAVHGLTDAAAQRLLAYDWPGNVRELRNAMERAVALTPYERIAVDDLPERIRGRGGAATEGDGAAAPASGPLPSMAEVEKRYIERVLEAVEGNKSQAARILGLDRKTLYRKLERYGLE